jgi:hypothetical protein
MVLGLFEGSIDIKLNGNTFASGQKISGTVFLKLNQMKKARELRVEFYGEIRRRSGGRHPHSHTERVFQIRQQLSGERAYNNGETFNFEITVPEGISVQAPGVIGSIMGMFMPHPTFYVHASLDAPNEFDINKRVMVNITSNMVNVQQVAMPASQQEALELTRKNIEEQQKLRPQ